MNKLTTLLIALMLGSSIVHANPQMEIVVRQAGYISLHHYQSSSTYCQTVLVNLSPEYPLSMAKQSSLWGTNLCDNYLNVQSHLSQSSQQPQQQSSEIQQLRSEIAGIKSAQKERERKERRKEMLGQFDATTGKTCYTQGGPRRCY